LGFQTAYIYWISLWVGNAGIAIAMIGYLEVFFPSLSDPALATIAALSVLWAITIINAIGMRSIGAVQIITTILKFVPLILVVAIGFNYFHPEYITSSFNVTDKSNFSAFSYAATLTLWAFLGVESASIPADSIKNPARDIPIATIFGTVGTAVIYIASAVAIMGILPAKTLAESASPFAAAIGLVCGKWGLYIAAGGAAIACIGSLNGLILCQAQVPMAAAADSLFPKIFGKRSKAGIPVFGLIISSLLISILLLSTSNESLVDQFQLLILIASTTNLIAYLYAAVAEIIIFIKNPEAGKLKFKKTNIIIALFAAIYSFWAIFGSGVDIVFYMSMLVFSSFPIYGWICWYKKRQSELSKVK